MALTSYGPFPRTRVPGDHAPSWKPGERARRMRTLYLCDEDNARPKRKRARSALGLTSQDMKAHLADAYRQMATGAQRASTRSTVQPGQWC